MDAVTISVLPPYFWVDSASPWHFAQSRNDGYRSAEPSRDRDGHPSCGMKAGKLWKAMRNFKRIFNQKTKTFPQNFSKSSSLLEKNLWVVPHRHQTFHRRKIETSRKVPARGTRMSKKQEKCQRCIQLQNIHDILSMFISYTSICRYYTIDSEWQYVEAIDMT